VSAGVSQGPSAPRWSGALSPWGPHRPLDGLVPAQQQEGGLPAHSPIVMFPKPRVASRALCSFSWCLDSFNTLLAHRSRLVNTEWITPNLEGTALIPEQPWGGSKPRRETGTSHTHTRVCTHQCTCVLRHSAASAGQPRLRVGQSGLWELPSHSVLVCHLNPELSRAHSLSVGHQRSQV
jgi:hypothetical protein